MGIKMNAGLASSLKMSGAHPRYMIGKQTIYGMPIICFPMIIINFMTFIIKRGLQCPR